MKCAKLSNKRSKVLFDRLKMSELKYKNLLKSSLVDQKIIKKFNRTLIIQHENDRKEISRELHDEVSQILTSINFDLAVLARITTHSEQKIRDKISSTHDLILKSVDVIHSFSRKLRPVVLDDLGLLEAIKALIKEFIQNTSINITLETKCKRINLNDLQKTILYRILQESLSNAIKHSNAKNIVVKVTLKMQKKNLALVIHDNGNPKRYRNLLNVPKLNGGIGIIGMIERARLVKGNLSIVSRPKIGTSVSIIIPLTNN